MHIIQYYRIQYYRMQCIYYNVYNAMHILHCKEYNIMKYNACIYYNAYTTMHKIQCI